MTTKQIQHLLAYLGYGVAPDGISGPETQGALRAFQAAQGLEPDGIAGPETQQALKEAVLGDPPVPQEGGFWKEIRCFSRQEFACRCAQYHSPYCDGFPVEPDETLVRLADRVRGHFGRPAHCSSGIRCPRHNADSGGVWNSKHMEGKALDFFVEGVTGQALLGYVQAQPETSYAYIIEGQYVHMDVR